LKYPSTKSDFISFARYGKFQAEKMMITKVWKVAELISPEADEALEKYPAFLRQVLFNRGIDNAESASSFLAALPPEDNDPMQMLGMATAVDRLSRAIDLAQPIVIYGDYDADGVTATALLVSCLKELGAKVSAYIPDRFDEGYGLNIEAMRKLSQQGAQIVVTVDCGIRSIAEAQAAQQLGLDLIISDHHSIGPELPSAYAIINCKLPNDPSPNKDLSGSGTAYKIAQALVEYRNAEKWIYQDLLDLAAIGTVADLVPIRGENRWLVRQGLRVLRNPHRQGILSLIGIAGLKAGQINAGDLGFMLGPRINAAGRLGSAMHAYDLLMSREMYAAGKLAQQLDNLNRERRTLTEKVAETAEKLVLEKGSEANILLAFDKEFHPGVAGLAASKLSEIYYRPAIVGEIGEEFTTASCRSIQEFHITNALQECADLFENFGGHAAAAGFTIANEKLEELTSRLGIIADRELGEKVLQPIIEADMEIDFADLNADILEHLQLVEPSGMANPQVRFISRNLEIRSKRRVGADGAHLKLAVSDGWVTYDAIAFRQGAWADAQAKRIDLCYRFEVNEFNGKKTLQLNVIDIKASD
jgi:single-stranded-DNA-specific exonuclease